MKMRNIFVLVLALTMVLALCACGTTEEQETTPATTTAPTVTAPTEEATEPTEDTRITYTVKVVDEGGNPIANADVQLCDKVCFPSVTDANGVATWKMDEEGAYKASFMTVPAGYEYTTDATEFYFADGEYELTITLKAVA